MRIGNIWVADDRPVYVEQFWTGTDVETLIETTPWESRTSARMECFMSDPPGLEYTYGTGAGVRTYVSITPRDVVSYALNMVNAWEQGLDYNVCFLNRYDDAGQMLGWHADDSSSMDHTHPICVLSYGQPREIWWRPNGQTGVVPDSQRRLLENGSLFIMPAGFQLTHQHRIPKGDRPMGPRVSLTFRRFKKDPTDLWNPIKERA